MLRANHGSASEMILGIEQVLTNGLSTRKRVLYAKAKKIGFTGGGTNGDSRGWPWGAEPAPIDQGVDPDDEVAGVPLDEVINQIGQGYKPIVAKSFYGEDTLAFIPEPITPHPTLFIIEKYKTCSYLGNYGAGKVLNTFSLLPGEKTTITVKTFRNTSETLSNSKNILDSFSQESTDELTSEFATEYGKSKSIGVSANGSADMSVGASIPLEIINVTGSVGASLSGGMNATRSDTMSVLSATVDKHVEQTNSNREVTVNTSSVSTVNTGEEQTIVRELQNINLSRVQNFVFRQMLQEYITITHLDDVIFGYTNGYTESTQYVRISELKAMLTDLFVAHSPSYVDEIFNKILFEYCNVMDYESTLRPFFTMTQKTLTDCLGSLPNVVFDYFRKIPGLHQVYDPSGSNIDVPGIILDAKKRIVRTDSVVVDALLGQGEALDCYNMRLQDAAATKALSESATVALQNKIINTISTTDPELAADKFKKVFGNCCDVAQSGCGCGCDGKVSVDGKIVVGGTVGGGI